jgi:hypothetical protein
MAIAEDLFGAALHLQQPWYNIRYKIFRWREEVPDLDRFSQRLSICTP